LIALARLCDRRRALPATPQLRSWRKIIIASLELAVIERILTHLGSQQRAPHRRRRAATSDTLHDRRPAPRAAERAFPRVPDDMPFEKLTANLSGVIPLSFPSGIMRCSGGPFLLVMTLRV